MKKKKLALLLAVAMTVTSIDSTAMMVNAADFTSEEVQEQSVELTDEPSEAAVETDAETEDGGVISDNSSEDESIEITDEPQESADTEGEDAEIDIQEEDEASPEDVFSAEDEIAVLNEEGGEEPATEDGESPATAVTLTPDTEYEANIDEEGKAIWYKFTPEKGGKYIIYSSGDYDSYVALYTDPEGEEITHNDDNDNADEDDNNFELEYPLEAGTTYYYQVRMYSPDKTGIFNVKFEKAPEVQSVSATNVLLEGVAGIPFYTYADLEITYTGGKDTVRKCTLNYQYDKVWNNYATDGKDITVTLEDAKQKKYPLGSRLEAGTYTMKFACGDIESEPYTVSIKQMSDSPLYKGAMNLDQDTKVTSPLKGIAYYSFEAPAAGTYYMDTYDSNYSVYIDYGEYDSYGQYTNWYQEEKKIVYIGFYGGSLNSDANENAIMKIKTQSDVASIEYTPESTTAIKGLDNLQRYDYMPGLLTLTYKDGTKDTLRAQFESGVSDKQGHTVYSKTYAVDGENETPVDWGDTEDDSAVNSLPAGTYKIYFTLNPEEQDTDNSVKTSTDLTVNTLDYDNLTSLEMGEHELAAGVLQKKWYSFSPKKDGFYHFDWNVGDYSGDSEGVGRTWYKYQNGELDSTFDYWNMEDGHIKVAKGEKYIVGVVSERGKKVSLNLTKDAEADKMEIVSYSPNPMTFISGFETVGFDKLKATVFFDDGTKKSVTKGYNDSDYKLRTRLVQRVDEEENYYDESEVIPAGNYEYVLSYDGINLEYVPVTVVDPADRVVGELKKDETTTASNDGTMQIFKFVPETSGRYEFAFNVNVKKTELRNSDGAEVLTNGGDENENENLYASLQEGVTYYLSVSARERYKEIAVSPKLLSKPVKIASKVLGDDYIEGIDTFGSVQLETTITYSDDTTEKVVNNRTADGLQVKYKYEGEIYELNNYDTLEAGEWKIIPYLEEVEDTRDDDDDDTDEYSLDRASDTDSELPDVEPATLTVKELKLSELPELTKDKAESIKAAPRKLYRFTADKKATYVINDSGNVETEVYRYEKAEDEETGYWGSYNGGFRLEKDETCVVAVTAYSDATVTVSEEKKPVDPDDGEDTLPKVTTADFTLTEGLRKQISFGKNRKFVDASFTPAADGYYRINTENVIGETSYGVYRSYIELSGNSGYIQEADDSIIERLEKGKTYTYRLKLYDEDWDYSRGSFDLSFERVETKAISKMELVLVDGVKASECTMFDSLGDFYNIKITYADNTSKVYEWSDSGDEYGNTWDICDIEDEATGYDSEAIRHQVYFEYWDAADNGTRKETASQTIYTSALKSLNEVKENTQIKPFADRKYKKYYRFTAPDTGTYLVESSMVERYTIDNSVYTVEGNYHDSHWSLDWTSADTEYLDAGHQQVYMKKGTTYLLELRWYSDTDGSAATFQIKKVKTLKSIEMTKRPDQTTLLPGGRAWASLKGMEITASYVDGEDERITYGQTDSQGMSFEQNGNYTWVNEKLCRVPVSMGGYQIYVTFEAADWKDIPEMKPGTEEKLDIAPGNQTIRRFIPDKTGYYSFSATNAYINIIDPRTQEYLSEGQAYLEAGNTYQIYVVARKKDVILKVVAGSCDWEVIDQIQETCTTDGKVVRKCKTHGDTSTEILSAFGHYWSSWKVTKEATCADGEQQRTCNRCKTVEKRTIAATKSHSFSAWKVTKNATVLSEGVQQRTCSVCGKTETASVAKLPATIALNVKGTIPLKVKQSFTVKVTMGAGDRVVSWKTSNKKVVSVKNGKIKGLKAGKSATITVQLASGKKASFKVKVQKPAVATKSIKVTNAATGRKQGKKATMKRGQSLKLKAALTPITSLQKVKWSTSNKKIVTVSKSGVIKAKKKGKATITVKSGNKKYNIKITVK